MYELRVITTMGLGLLAGALLTEALVLVPYWRTISGAAFTALHEGVAPRLYSFFAPLTIGAVGVAALSGIVTRWSSWSSAMVAADWFSVGASVLAISLLGFYRLYFEKANEELPGLARMPDPTRLTEALRRWQKVHAIRTVVCAASFGCAVLAIVN